MYVDTTTAIRGDKVYVRHLLRTSYRENGKVKHKTLLNLSRCSDSEVAAIKLALKHKDRLASLVSLDEIKTSLGKRIGAVWLLKKIGDKTGVSSALGSKAEGKLAMMQIIARVIDQGSRLSAVRLAKRHSICEVMGISRVDEDDLYKNLDWLADHQERIEKKLFNKRFGNSVPTLFLYDVTSSYLEGHCNELSNWGYNRDKKKGKQQIVVGLLAGPDGLPVAVRVFEGNTTDSKTVAEQIRTLAESFGVRHVTVVGDRGMIKGPQIEAMPEDFRYITAITKPQIRKMLSEGTLQYELFSDHVCEVEDKGVRYIMRRNPIRATQIAQSRSSKYSAILEIADRQTKYLAQHPRAVASKALDAVTAKINKLKADTWLTATEKDRVITIEKDEQALSQLALLDGCYVIKSDVPKPDADAQTLHDRYCDLEMVERAFRTMKTSHLELRPVFVRKKSRTKAHVFVVMLALLFQRELERCWAHLDVTVQEGIDELASIHVEQIQLGQAVIDTIPTPTPLASKLLDAAAVSLPSTPPSIPANVHTKKKLPKQRKRT